MTISCQSYDIHLGSPWEALKKFLTAKAYTTIFVLVDDNTKEHCLPIFNSNIDHRYNIISIESGEVHKTLQTCQSIWDALIEGKADRKSVLINLGGGVIGDMGGFCASTFMRGMDFIQIPTTLLSMVDASVGAKLGVDYHGFKNLIGIFNEPQSIYIDPLFLKTLPMRELKSGFAEVIKHALIQDPSLWAQIQEPNLATAKNWDALIGININIKKNIVENDPLEKGQRKALNFGHTIGHAVEKYYLVTTSPLLHGEAIAIGMICEAHLSHQKKYLVQHELDEVVSHIQGIYPNLPTCIPDHSTLLTTIAMDKKNEGGKAMCTLIHGIGRFKINQATSEDSIIESFKYYDSLYNN